MAFTDFLFNGSPPPEVNQYSTKDTQPPVWWQAYTKGLIEKANSIAAQPYQAYQGPRIAGFTPDQEAAFGQVRSNQGKYNSLLAQSGQGFSDASNPSLNQEVFNSYMNPYTTGVVDRIAELGNRNLMEKILPGVNDTFIRSGQFGSSVNQGIVGQAIRDTQSDILGQQSQTLMNAFDQAMANTNTGLNRQMTGAANLGNLAQLGQSMDLKDIASLENVGQTQQQQTQKSLDTAYNDFITQRDYPMQMVRFLDEAIRGVPASTVGGTTNVTSTAPGTSFSPSPLSMLVGASLSTSGAGQQATAKARGCVVRAMRSKPKNSGAQRGLAQARGRRD